MSTVSPDSVAQDQIKAFVRRIEALEDEIKVLNEDKSEVYKEAKGCGFDTKIVRKVIAARRQGAAERAEQDALFQLYWDAVHGLAHAHVEIIEEFDPATGEILTSSEPVAPQERDMPASATRFPGAGSEAHPEAKATKAEPSQAQGASTDGVASRASVGAGSDASITVPRHEVEEADEGEVTPPASSADTPEPASPPSEIAEPGDGRAVLPSAAPVVAGNVMVFRTHDPETHFLNSEGLSRLHGCLKPELCGSSEPRKRLCFNCSLQHDGPTHQDQAEAG